MSRRLLLLLVLSLAAFLRLHRLTTIPPGLYRDEAMNGSNALEALETGRFQVFYPENGGREGLYIDVATVFVHFWGNQPWVLRLPAAIFGILTVWGVYLLAAELSSVEVGLLAAFFLATSFWHVTLSRLAFRANAAPLLLTWSLYLLLASLRRLRQNRPWLGIALLAGVVYGLGFYTYIAYRATPFLVAAVLLFQHGTGDRSGRSGSRKRTVHLTILFAVTAALVTAPLMLYFAGHPGSFLGRTVQVSVVHSPHPLWEVVLNLWRTGRMFFTRGDVNWRHNIAWRAELYWPVAILMVVGFVRGRGQSGRPPGPGPNLWNVALGWLVVAAAPVVLSGQNVPHALRAILMIPPAVMLAASGAWQVHEWLALRVPRGWRTVASVAFLLVLSYEPYHSYFDRWANDPKVPPAFDRDAVQIAAEINLLPTELPKYVVTPDFMAAQPVMFLTRSYTELEQQRTQIHYILDQPCAPFAASRPEAKVFCLTGLQ